MMAVDDNLILMRVVNRYNGEEGKCVEGEVIRVRPERARQLIANGNAAPIVRQVGPGETKPAGPFEKKPVGGSDGPTEPASSSAAVQVSRTLTLPKRLGGKFRKTGGA
jgi:hypothetical protein